jgi:hypothetical protein
MKTRSILLASALFSTAVLAHEGGHDVRGIVTQISAHELTVMTNHGAEKFVLTPDTVFVKNGSPAAAKDIQPADRAVVHAKKKGGAFEAFKVQFTTPKQQ